MKPHQRKLAKAIGQFMDRHIAMAEISIRETARRTGVSASYMSKAVRGEVLPSREMVRSFLYAMEFTTEAVRHCLPECEHCGAAIPMRPEQFNF